MVVCDVGGCYGNWVNSCRKVASIEMGAWSEKCFDHKTSALPNVTAFVRTDMSDILVMKPEQNFLKECYYIGYSY